MDISEYIEQHTTHQEEALQWLVRQTHLQTIHPRMLSGPIQGRFLSIISSMLSPKRILEIGSFTGYSALCLSKGLAPDGILHTIECNDELEDLIRQAINLSGQKDQIILHIGNALTVIPTLNETFDLIFIDGDKREYPAYYDLVMPKLRVGGILLADNVLWDGKVLEQPIPSDLHTQGIASFNAKVQADPRVENVLLPFRDGLMMVRKL